MNTENFIDLHMHIGPEIIPRRFTVRELIAAEKKKLKAIALKNHMYPTMPLIKSESSEELMLIGSVTLNNYVGGLNPDVIYASAKMSARPTIVWFPTIHSNAFLRQSKYEIPPEWVGQGFAARKSSEVSPVLVTENNKLTLAAINVLKAIKDTGAILATGHISWQESKMLVKEALLMEIKKIIITHPIYQLINMPINVQKELAANKEVFIEQSYAMHLIDKIPISRIVAQIKAIGADKCILTSDVGQTNSPAPSEALKFFAELLLAEGISAKDIKMMLEINPAKLLEL